MSINHLGEFLVGFQALPFQAGSPILEESPRPGLTVVVPELTEGLPEQIRRIQPFVCRQQRLERLPALQGEILAMRQQRVFLSLDVAASLTTESGCRCPMVAW